MKKTFSLFAILFYASIAYSQCFVSNFGSLGTLYKTTGNAALDQKFNNSQATLQNLFGVSVNQFVYEDGQSPNAYATRSDNPMYDGLVAFGRTMLASRLWNINKGEYAIAGILAHEYAHVMQIKKGTSYSSGKLKELHADYMAGYFIGTQGFPQNGINAFANDLYSIGDYDFWSPQHHGTPEERVDAMLAGFQNRNLSANSAYSAGLKYVRGGGTTSPPTPQKKTKVVPCTHLVHPNGDLIPCSHPAHYNGDVVPCQHICPSPYGPVRCHPNGDLVPCSHPAHYNGDVTPCQHIAHPNGDIIEYWE